MNRSSRKFLWPWLLLAFLLPAALLTFAYAHEGFAPFGDKSILTSDMASQYVEFFCGLKQGDVFFSWSKALGSSYIGVFSYYLSSPLSLLTLLVPNEAMPMGLMWLTVLKFALTGLAGYLFFSRWLDRQGAAPLLCAVSYAMCAYAVAFSLCIMWLDGMIWLPVILIGLEQLLEGRRRWLFAAALAVCFFSTWYISYMIGGFCLLWFLWRSFVLRPSLGEFLLRCRQFLLSALWALCLTAWLWLPTLLSMFGGKFSIPLMDYSGLFNFSLPRLFTQLLPGQVQPFNENLPYLFCGTLSILGFVAWFFLRGVSLREKLGSAALTAILILSLWLSPLDRVWHLFKFPNFFLSRYSFLLSFFLVLLAGQALSRGLDALGKNLPRLTRVVALALTVLVCADLTGNAVSTFRQIDAFQGYESYSAYQDYYAANASLVDTAQFLSGGDSFSRIGSTRDRGLNAPLSFGYNGITHYSSFFNSQVNRLLKSLGFAQSWYWTAYYGSTPFTDALLDIRYVLSSTPLPDCYQALDGADNLTLYETPVCLPLAFTGDQDLLQLTLTSGDPFQNQNQLFSALADTEQPLFQPISPLGITESADGTVTLLFQGTGQPIYADLSSSGLVDLRVNGVYLSELNTSETRCIHYLGTPARGETLTVLIRCSSLQDWSGRFYTLDEGLLTDRMSALSGLQAQPRVSGSSVELQVSVQEAQAVFTTIPDEPGWSVRIDGTQVSASSFLGTFLAVEVPAGSHVIQFQYASPGLAPALILGLAVLVLTAVMGLRRLRKPGAYPGADCGNLPQNC